MSNLSELMAAMERLSPSALDRLRKHLRRLEQRAWEKALDEMSAERKRRGITDRQIDAAIMRRRREGRR